MCWALQRVERYVPGELQGAARGLRTVVLPSAKLSTLPELAWSLSQHPRARFVVVANGLEACGAAARHCIAFISRSVFREIGGD